MRVGRGRSRLRDVNMADYVFSYKERDFHIIICSDAKPERISKN